MIKVFDGQKELTTQLYFHNDVPPSFEDYVKGRDSQFPQKIKPSCNGRIITFDVVLDKFSGPLPKIFHTG